MQLLSILYFNNRKTLIKSHLSDCVKPANLIFSPVAGNYLATNSGREYP